MAELFTGVQHYGVYNGHGLPGTQSSLVDLRIMIRLCQA